VAPNPNTRCRSTTRTRPRAGGAQPQYSWRSEKRIFTWRRMASGQWQERWLSPDERTRRGSGVIPIPGTVALGSGSMQRGRPSA